MKITQQIANIIRNEASLAEEKGCLTDKMLALVYQESWFKLLVPTLYGGAGMQLPEVLRLEEELAYADGALGWTVTLCTGAAWFAGFLEPELAARIFADKKVCFAGSGAVNGTAKELPDGYLINGFWKYATGALHATVFTANCLIQNKKGQNVLAADGSPKVRSFVLMKDEVEILSDWPYFGLIATGSHAFKVKDVQVPESRMFYINDQQTKLPGHNFKFPFLQYAEITTAVNSLGMARHFMDLIEDAFDKRSGQKYYQAHQLTFFKAQLVQAKEDLANHKKRFYQAFNQAWQALQKTNKIEAEILTHLSLITREMAHACWYATQKMYPYAGLEAAKKDTELNRVWRDIHTASQHALLTFKV